MDGPGHRHWLGTRAAVTLATLVALLSLATGIATITVRVQTGPLAPWIPTAVQQAAGFTGALTGFLLLMSAAGLRRGYRVAWYSTLVLLPVTAAHGLIQSSPLSLPLVGLSLVSLPTILATYRRFDRPVSISAAQLGASAALTGTLIYGTAGTYTLRESYVGVDSLTDALYFTVVTASTVGYGDITPTTQGARLFALSLVVLGTASFALALGSVLGPAIQARFSRALGTMSTTRYDMLEDHLVVLGYGDLTEPLLEELDDVPFVVLTPDADQASALRQRGIDVATGDPSDEAPLESVGIRHARAVIAATEDDADDAFAILTARALNPDVRIVAAATMRENVEKLRRAGADVVISPAAIGGRLLTRSALGEEDIEAVADSLLDEGEHH